MFEGAWVPPFYDSMIAKLIVRGRDRAEAVRRLGGALQRFRIDGIATNLPFLRAVAAHPQFQSNHVDTRWLERELMPAFGAGRDS